jgi:thiosulfate/3-mercaptopyruvate sulfurtransferase
MIPLVLEPKTLAELLGDDPQHSEYLIVDLCQDENYQRHHIPGAVHISPSELVSGVQPAVGKLPTLERLESLFSRIGYEPGKHIIAYDDEGGGWAGRFIWTLDVIGHKNSAYSYLNGGLIAWAQDQLPLTASVPETSETKVSLTIHPEFIAEKEEVLASLDDANTQVWDARSPEEYMGTKVFAARGGHIPGAINLDWLELMDRHNGLRLREDIAELVTAKGFESSGKIITHCQTHHRSGLTYLVGKILDLNIKAYHGSWSEWGNDSDTPIDNPSA